MESANTIVMKTRNTTEMRPACFFVRVANIDLDRIVPPEHWEETTLAFLAPASAVRLPASVAYAAKHSINVARIRGGNTGRVTALCIRDS